MKKKDSTFLLPEEIDFETNLGVNDVIKIAKDYINKNKDEGPYEIDEKSIIYDKEAYWLHEPAWKIELIFSDWKDFDDNAIFLVISDKKGELACVLDNFGRPFKKYGSMGYELMTPLYAFKEFDDMNKNDAKEYFEWYISQIKHRISVLKEYVHSENGDIIFDYSPESLIPLWDWYEQKIKLIKKSAEELKEEYKIYTSWVHDSLSHKKISMDTLIIGMDIAIYFAEVVVRSCHGKIQWGYFTKPKNRMSVNEPTLLGFKYEKDLNPRLIISNCTWYSSNKKNSARLFDMYQEWMSSL